MKSLKYASVILAILFSSQLAHAQALVMNAGEAYGQLVYLTADEVKSESQKFKDLNPMSIPVFGELPVELAVVAGAITLQEQNLLSHVQLKSRARHTPNLDISKLPDGLSNQLMSKFKDGDWVYMLLDRNGTIVLEPSTQEKAIAFLKSKTTEKITLKSDLSSKKIYASSEVRWYDFDKVGSKAANYSELELALNTPDRIVVRPGFAVPFYYYQQFIDANPEIKTAIEKLLQDPLLNRVTAVSYRAQKLDALRTMITNSKNNMNEELVKNLVNTFETVRTKDGKPRKLKIRSSTNAEDLPNFNGAGLYSSKTYKPVDKKAELSFEAKKATLKEAMLLVWSSIWNMKAYEERSYFNIPHAEVKMGIQVKQSFSSEEVDGVMVTKNIANDPKFPGPGVYFEAQRGDNFSVANPKPGEKAEKVLVLYNPAAPQDKTQYKIHILQRCNVADDKKTILPAGNPNPIMTDSEIRDLVSLALKAQLHFETSLGKGNPNFALDLEFKVDMEDSDTRQVYFEQARPYIE